MGYGAGPIHQLYDSCGPESNGPYALCGFIFGAAEELPNDDVLRPQVRAFRSRTGGAYSILRTVNGRYLAWQCRVRNCGGCS